jgi:hypothetical protein
MLAAASVLTLAGGAGASEPIAYLTEIHRKAGTGEILVHRAVDGGWKPPQPLLALRAGDQIKVTGDARVVVLYHGAGTTAVSAQMSPFTVKPPATLDKPAPPQVTAALLEFFLGKQAAPAFKGAVTRSAAPTIVSPRYTRLFPGTLVFEWEGAAGQPCTVRVLGAQSVLWEQRNVVTGTVAYPASAPALQAGARYAWELHAAGHPPQRTEFEIMTEGDARRVRDALAAVEQTVPAGHAPGTVTVMRTAILSEDGLFADARRELEAAERRTPDDPTLPYVLAHVYEHIGLTAHAREALHRASR